MLQAAGSFTSSVTRCVLLSAFLLCLPVMPAYPQGPAQYKVLYSFQGGADGANPIGALTLDSAGNLYGATAYGGVDAQMCENNFSVVGCGTVFELSPGSNSWMKTLLFTFCGSGSKCHGGAVPNGSLVFDSSGNLYGTTFQGGQCAASSSGCGTAFQLVPSGNGTWQHNILYRFQGGSDAATPNGGLVFDVAGQLYGTSGGSGADRLYTYGTVFRLTPGSPNWTESVLYSFCAQANCTDGEDPVGGVVFDSNGHLYGITNAGGLSSFACPSYCGVLFELTPEAHGQWTESVLHSLLGADGGYSQSTLVRDADGNFYGTTTIDGVYAAGTVFKLSATAYGWRYTILYEFPLRYAHGSFDLRSPLALDGKGNLYGTLGASDVPGCCGLVYKLSPRPHGMWAFTDLHDFNGKDGSLPSGGLTIEPSGKLYGMTQMGGANNSGVVFEIVP